MKALVLLAALALAACGGPSYVTTEGDDAPTYRQQAMFSLGSALLLQATQRPAYVPVSMPTHCVSQGMGAMVMTDCQ